MFDPLSVVYPLAQCLENIDMACILLLLSIVANCKLHNINFAIIINYRMKDKRVVYVVVKRI